MQPVLTCTLCRQLSPFTFLLLVPSAFYILLSPLEEPSLRFLACLTFLFTFPRYSSRESGFVFWSFLCPGPPVKILRPLWFQELPQLLPSHTYFYPANTDVSRISVQVQMKQGDGGTQYCRTVSVLQTVLFVIFRTDCFTIRPWRTGVSWKAKLSPRLVTRCKSFLGFALLFCVSLLLRACWDRWVLGTFASLAVFRPWGSALSRFLSDSQVCLAWEQPQRVLDWTPPWWGNALFGSPGECLFGKPESPAALVRTPTRCVHCMGVPAENQLQAGWFWDHRCFTLFGSSTRSR